MVLLTMYFPGCQVVGLGDQAHRVFFLDAAACVVLGECTAWAPRV